MDRKITFTLDRSELLRAKREILDFKKEFEAKAAVFMEKLVEAGVEIATRNVVNMAFRTGALAISIQGTAMYVDGTGNRGIIFTDSPYAVFVEFGTGRFAKNPKRTGGWHYIDDVTDEWIFTRGTPPVPFMNNTALELEAIVHYVAKEVFG